jgi:transposase
LLYKPLEFKQRYLKRGRGESVFGSLTNWLGDRLKVSREEVMRVGIGARIIGYLAKIYVRYLF